MAAILNKCSTARPLSVTSFRPRDFVLASVFVLEVMTDLQVYRFEPERVPNAEDSENEEVNNRLEGTSWVPWERCETCLLYTSPSPRDGLLSRMPSSA